MMPIKMCGHARSRWGSANDISDVAGTAVIDADLVLLCVPVGAMGDVAAQFAADLPADAIVSDVEVASKAYSRRYPPHFRVPLSSPRIPSLEPRKAGLKRALRHCSKAAGAS